MKFQTDVCIPLEIWLRWTVMTVKAALHAAREWEILLYWIQWICEVQLGKRGILIHCLQTIWN